MNFLTNAIVDGWAVMIITLNWYITVFTMF